MALFCPSCHNMLLVRQEMTSMQFHCRTCPYIYSIREKLTRKMFLNPKKADEPLNEEENMNLGAKAPASCPNCSNTEAFYYEIQIRSSDEPMTTFYCCTACKFRWREN
ncbi:dna-directed rna polymerase iii rpc11 [Cystoisospora suis]|uniref:DNA-directed RNA polymerase subunit n=1 Tax=Cystoisospora suis TaxID=483139 RepID=A0A2C6L913_9APIC|nr:dna-directed rna polymerase iii rpc11 [Cystoisospora suis]